MVDELIGLGEWLDAQDRMPQVIVAPNEGLTERVISLQMGGQGVFGYEVFVGLVVPREFDRAALRRRAAFREAIRASLFDTQLLKQVLSDSWDVDYDPSPGARHVQGINDGHMRDSVQGFLFSVTEPRYRPIT